MEKILKRWDGAKRVPVRTIREARTKHGAKGAIVTKPATDETVAGISEKLFTLRPATYQMPAVKGFE
jgi:hypothetical protein